MYYMIFLIHLQLNLTMLMWFPLSSGLLYGFPHINMILHYTKGGFPGEKMRGTVHYDGF